MDESTITTATTSLYFNRCNIPRINLLTSNLPQLYHHRRNINDYKNYKNKAVLPALFEHPIILVTDDDIEDNEDNASNYDTKRMNFRYLVDQSNITKTLGNEFMVELSSSNSYSSHRKRVTLDEYLNDVVSNEIMSDQMSNETWYLFGETFNEDWRNKLLDVYPLPPCQTCEPHLSALSFGIGGIGSGVQWHFHGPGFSETIHGRKHFVLFPPEQEPDFDPNYNSRHWMEHVYPSLRDKPWECTIGAGELLYFPDQWHHATINLDRYNAFVSTFTTENLEDINSLTWNGGIEF